jgi:hypothetical protein
MDKLYEVTDLHKMFPKDVRKDVKIGDLNKLLKQFGTYRKVGKAVVLTAADIRDFFRHVAAMKRAGATKPADNTPGVIVAIDGLHDTHAPAQAVFVDWCPRGYELCLLDAVKGYSDEKAKVIATHDMSFGEFQKWRAEMRVEDHWSCGKFHFRTNKVMKVFGRRARSTRASSKRTSTRRAAPKTRAAKRRAA